MTPEERSLLESTHQLVKENNALLHNLKNRARFGTAVKILYWTIIIGLSFGALYFIQPYIDMVKGLTGGSSSTTPQSSDGSNNYAEQLQELLK